MRFFLKYLALLLLSLAGLTWYIPFHYDMEYPQPAGPRFTDEIRKIHARIIEENHVEVVLVGDSTLDRSVDETLFSEVIGQRAHMIRIPASSTALWYLVLKNILIGETTNPPDTMILMFRDTILTLPDYHVSGGRETEIDEYATANEDFVVQTAYLNFMNPLEIAAEQYLPLYGARRRITDSIESYSRALLPGLFLSCGVECSARTFGDVFINIENINPDFSQGVLMGEEENLYTSRALNFDAQIGRSFLPELIRLARESGINLIFVHARTLTFPNLESQPDGLAEYKSKLFAYLAQNNVAVLDYSFDPRLPPEYFADPLHMNAQGQAVFSRILGEDIRNLIPR
ncbi:MAG: hypothetical protein HFACDABA_02796 [Anaerolineales bacterium]|nr:hypothetical protein [Anaerolineales bacterium]